MAAEFKLTEEPVLSKVTAKPYAEGHMVCIPYQRGLEIGIKTITAEEAVKRASDIGSIPVNLKDNLDLAEALWKAADEAKINRDGVGFNPKDYDSLMKFLKAEGAYLAS